MKTKHKLLVGITQNDELYFLEIERQHQGHDYFAMSGFTVRPTTREEAEEETRNNLKDGELWQQAVQAGNTELGLNDWVDYVIESDGDICMFDNSLFDEEITIDGVEYLFESCSCGQHEVEDLKHYFIDRKLFDLLMKIWKKYHLKKYELEKSGSDMAIVEEALSINQDYTALALEAVNIINNEE